MTLIREIHVECDGCHARVRGTVWPDTWLCVRQSGQPERHYCTAECVAKPGHNSPQLVREARARAIAITPAQHATLRLVAAGLSNRQIAERTGQAESTVKNRLSVAFPLLHARDRTQAVIIAHWLGLVEIDALGRERWGQKTP